MILQLFLQLQLLVLPLPQLDVAASASVVLPLSIISRPIFLVGNCSLVFFLGVRVLSKRRIGYFKKD